MFIETTHGEYVNLRHYHSATEVPKSNHYLMLHSEEFGTVKVWRPDFEALLTPRHVVPAEPGITAFLIHTKVKNDEEFFDFLGTVIAWSVDAHGCHSAIVATWGEPLANVALLFPDGHVETMSMSPHGQQKYESLEALSKFIREVK